MLRNPPLRRYGTRYRTSRVSPQCYRGFVKQCVATRGVSLPPFNGRVRANVSAAGAILSTPTPLPKKSFDTRTGAVCMTPPSRTDSIQLVGACSPDPTGSPSLGHFAFTYTWHSAITWHKRSAPPGHIYTWGIFLTKLLYFRTPSPYAHKSVYHMINQPVIYNGKPHRVKSCIKIRSLLYMYTWWLNYNIVSQPDASCGRRQFLDLEKWLICRCYRSLIISPQRVLFIALRNEQTCSKGNNHNASIL